MSSVSKSLGPPSCSANVVFWLTRQVNKYQFVTVTHMSAWTFYHKHAGLKSAVLIGWRPELWGAEGRSGARLKKLDRSGHVVAVELSVDLQSSWRISNPISVAHNGWHLHTWRFLWSKHWGAGVPSAWKGCRWCYDGCVCSHLRLFALLLWTCLLHILPEHVHF